MEGNDEAGNSDGTRGGQMKTGWWRLNWWGLLLLVPALVLALYLPAKDAYAQYRNAEPRKPVSGAPGGSVTFAGARLRLEQLSVASGLKNTFDEPVDIPDGTRAWQATIDFDEPDTKALSLCRVYLETGDGKTFSASPEELSGLDAQFDFCTPDDPDVKSATFQRVEYFLLPQDVRPVAVEITLKEKLPAYARLTPS
jgi:hypothetical protein